MKGKRGSLRLPFIMESIKPMQPATPRLRSARDPREDILFSELELAVRWDRPSILFAVYDSHDVRRKVTRRLARRLYRIGQRARDFRITQVRADVPLALRDQPGRGKTVFMVSGLQQADVIFKGNPYKPLNIRREILVESRIRAVFWLTEREAMDLARQAPDFWAFRHRVVEFLDPLDGGAGMLASEWSERAHHVRAGGEDELWAKITYRAQLLEALDKGDWQIAYNLHLSLGRLYGEKPDFAQAQMHLKSAAALADSAGDSARHFDALIGLGVMLVQSEEFSDAAEIFQQAGGVNPHSPIPQMQLSALSVARGQADAARLLARQCVDQFPDDANAWAHLGWILGSLGDLVEAVSACRHALKLETDYARAWYQLGMLQSMLGEPDKALQALERACHLDDTESLYWQSLSAEWAAQGQPEKSLTCARRAVRANKLDPTAWLGLGGRLHSRRRLKAAVECYQRAFDLSGGDGSNIMLASACLSLMWQEKGDAQQADHWRMRSFSQLPNADALGDAAYYALCGDLVLAQDAVTKSLASNRWRSHLLRVLPLFKSVRK